MDFPGSPLRSSSPILRCRCGDLAARADARTAAHQCLEYVLKTNYANFIKGPAFHDTFEELLGNGIFNTGAPLAKSRDASAHANRAQTGLTGAATARSPATCSQRA